MEFNIGDKIYYLTGNEDVVDRVGTITGVFADVYTVIIDEDPTQHVWYTSKNSYGTHYEEYKVQKEDTTDVDKFLSSFAII